MTLLKLKKDLTKERAKRIIERLGYNLDHYKVYTDKGFEYNFPPEVCEDFYIHLDRLEHLESLPEFLEIKYFTDLKSRHFPNPYIKAGAILYLLENGLNLLEIARIFGNDHATIIHYRDSYSDYDKRDFNLIKKDVYNLLREYESNKKS